MGGERERGERGRREGGRQAVGGTAKSREDEVKGKKRQQIGWLAGKGSHNDRKEGMDVKEMEVM